MITISSRILSDAVVQVAVAGEVDLSTAHQLDAVLSAAVERHGAAAVEVDFGGVTFCDSLGIAALDQAYAAAAQRSVPFRLINVQPAVRRILDIVGLLEPLTGAPGRD